MKRVITTMVIALLMIQTCLADCNFKTDIVKQPNGKYLISRDCYLRLGDIKSDLEKRETQVKELNKSITMKDLALKKADERIMNWRDESYNQYERLRKQAKYNDYTKVLYFGGGFGLAILSVWAAGKLVK